MKFRTEIEIRPMGFSIGHDSRILAVGSCFAENIGRKLADAKFRIAVNPTGILFNPASIAASIRSFGCGVQHGELQHDGQRWFHFGFHGDFSAPTAEEALEKMNTARHAAAAALSEADTVILTLGTAWVYERGGEVVANCHRRPAAEFVRRRMGVEEVVSTLESLMTDQLRGKNIILTVSPVRHLGDTLAGNAVSKATLRLAAATIAERHPAVEYFPAFEIMTDDLRDYRFYDEDMIHPTPQAVEYIWERFTEAALTGRARSLLPQIEQIVATASHRPRDPRSAAHRELCRKTLQRIDSLPEIDFSTEAKYFLENIGKNL